MTPLLHPRALFLTLLALLPLSATANDSCHELGDSNGAKLFRKYANYTEVKIHKICKAFQLRYVQGPALSDTKKCLNAFEELRNLAKEQIRERESFCQLVQKSQICSAGTSQATCYQDQAKLQSALAENRRRLQTNAENFRKILNDVEKLQRASSHRLARDQETLTSGLGLGTISQLDLDKPTITKSQPVHDPAPDTKGKPTSSQDPFDPKPTSSTGKPASTVSGVDGTRTTPTTSSAPDSRFAGYPTLREYRGNLPRLLSALQQDIVVLEKENKVVQEVKQEYSRQANQALVLANQNFQYENQLESLPEDRHESKQELFQTGARFPDPPPKEKLVNPSSSFPEVSLEEARSPRMPEDFVTTLPKDRILDPGPTETLEEFSPGAANGYPDHHVSRSANRARKLHNLQGIRDQLKAQLATPETERNSAEWISEVIRESRAKENRLRHLSSVDRSRELPIDVESALADIDAQVREVLAAEGVLGEDSPSLFLRVKARIQIREHTLR